MVENGGEREPDWEAVMVGVDDCHLLVMIRKRIGNLCLV